MAAAEDMAELVAAVSSSSLLRSTLWTRRASVERALSNAASIRLMMPSVMGVNGLVEMEEVLGTMEEDMIGD